MCTKGVFLLGVPNIFYNLTKGVLHQGYQKGYFEGVPKGVPKGVPRGTKRKGTKRGTKGVPKGYQTIPRRGQS